MNNIILFDNDFRENLFPFTLTRPICEIRVGILTIREKWSLWMDGAVSHITQDYLSEKYPIHLSEKNLVINGSVLPGSQLCARIKQLKLNEALIHNNDLIAARIPIEQFESLMNGDELKDLTGYNIDNIDIIQIKNIWDIFLLNSNSIQEDYLLLTIARSSMKASSSNRLIESDKIFIEEGAKVECANLNASEGPIYIGKYAEILEGANIRGPVAICDHSVVKMGANIYGGTTIGPFSKVGGEINNSVIMGYSNKAHEGYLGNSVIGEWCNIGAGTQSSNLKNNYGEVKIWSYLKEGFENSGLQFAGLFMGDHSKCAIGTLFNTGTVVGVSCNIFGEGFPRNFIPSFSWGGKQGFKTYSYQDAVETMDKVLARRDKYLKETDRQIFKEIFDLESAFRKWDKK